MNKSYSEMIRLQTFEERLNYLKLVGEVGKETFGWDRYINQMLYNSTEWKRIRREVIIRDNGCDLAFEGYEILGKILIHHINPISKDDILNRDSKVFDLENLVLVSHNTHNTIHYSTSENTIPIFTERKKNDMCPWKH